VSTRSGESAEGQIEVGNDGVERHVAGDRPGNVVGDARRRPTKIWTVRTPSCSLIGCRSR
jgi:hypothetical protein